MPSADKLSAIPSTSVASNEPIAAASEARAVEKLTNEAIFLSLEDDAKRAMQLALAARERAKALGDRALLLRTLNVCSRCNFVQNKNLIAMASAIDALELAAELGDRRELAHALCSVTGIAFTMQLSLLTMPLVERAVRIAVDLGDRDLEARSRRLYAERLADLGRKDECARQFELAIDAVRSLDMPGFALRVELRYAIFNIGLVEAASADRIVEVEMPAVLELDRMNTNSIRPAALQSLQGNVAHLRSRVLALRGDLPQADAIALEGLSHCLKHNSLGMVPPLSLHRAVLQLKLGNPGGARETLALGLDAAQSMRPHHWIAHFCRQLERLEAGAGKTEASTFWLEQASKEEAEFAAEQAQFRAVLEPLVVRQFPESGVNSLSAR